MAVPPPGCPVSYSLLTSPKGLSSEWCFEFYKTHRIMWRYRHCPSLVLGSLPDFLAQDQSCLPWISTLSSSWEGKCKPSYHNIAVWTGAQAFPSPIPLYPPEGPFQVTKLPTSPSMVGSLMEFARIPPSQYCYLFL